MNLLRSIELEFTTLNYHTLKNCILVSRTYFDKRSSVLSVIFYGRNDNHGYNLHKRASLSLNNIAELLTHSNDEILFVDWNTQPGLPTFIESIHDLLTEKAKDLIKVIRVDFYTHEKLFSKKTTKATVEPVARNAAIVRSNPNNKWVLSTNTDMIFITKDSKKSLSDICSDLPDDFYELPRFSLPEIIWETFDRLAPTNVMEELKVLRTQVDLDEVITAGPILRYDAPGDFQLCLREQLIEIQGFDENMTLGWHVDSNLCRRLNLLNGETKSLEDALYGYHCEHTKVTTHFTSSSTQNDLIEYFERISSPYSSSVDKNWGLANIELEQFKVKDKLKMRFNALYNFAKAPVTARNPVYANSMGTLIDFPATHAIPYIIDAIYDYPKNTKFIYFGDSNKRFNDIKGILEDLDYKSIIIHKQNENSSHIEHFEDYPRVVILDLGFDANIFDISSTSHEEVANRFNASKLLIIKNFLNFFIANYQNTKLYSIPILTLNVETYDSGAGVFLKKWLHLPQVASNSRVRVAFFKKPLRNKKVKTLQKLVDKTITQINYLGDNYFAQIPLTPKMQDRQGLQLSSHQSIPHATEYLGITPNRRGVMLNRSGFIKFNLSQLLLEPNPVIISEIDRPRIDASNYDITGNFVLNDKQTTLKFSSGDSDTKAIVTKTSGKPNEISLLFDDLTYFSDHKFNLRLTNIGIFNYSKLTKSLVLKRSSDLSSRLFLVNGWSFSNENFKRWTTNAKFSINPIRQKIQTTSCIALEVNYFKNVSKSKFIKNVYTDDSQNSIKYYELPRLTKKHGRLIFIFVPKNCNGEIYVESLAEAFESFEINRNEPRKLYAHIGALGFSEGSIQSILLIILFPIFIFWVKTKKYFYQWLNRLALSLKLNSH